jgi:periplasmic protein TonB
MKIRFLIVMLSGILLACSGPAPEIKKDVRKPIQKPDEKVASLPQPLKTLTLNAYQHELALRISQTNLSNVYTDRPQALLRSVIVLKYVINADGKLLRREVIRSNNDKTTENIAMSSISNAAPFPKPGSHLLQNGKLEITETWLFNNDGRFQLRTIALPQMSE